MGTLFRKFSLLVLACTILALMSTPASADRQSGAVRATVFVRAPLALNVDAAAFDHTYSTTQLEQTESAAADVSPLALRLDSGLWSQSRSAPVTADPYMHAPNQPHDAPFNAITREHSQEGARLVYTLTE